MKYTKDYKNDTTYYFFKVNTISHNLMNPNWDERTKYFKDQIEKAYKVLNKDLGISNEKIDNHTTYNDMSLIILGVQNETV